MDKPSPTGRKASREFRREQLIEATIATVSSRGLSMTTLSDVAKAAGVSHGLVNFHFRTKERLLAETLAFMSNQHRGMWEAAVSGAGQDAAERLNALILSEFSETHMSPDRLNAWCAFWGESVHRSTYLEQCGDNDRAYIEAFTASCNDLIAGGGYEIDARLAGRVLRLTIEGVWLELMFTTMPYPIEEARKTAFFCASTLFPRHFNAEGLIKA
jgi:TetR/AcrR family transcriptional repressor of bet genes